MNSSPWEPTKEEGLYLHRPSGNYYTRFQVNGKRTWRSLRVKVYSQAVVKHRKKRLEQEETRQAGGGIGVDFRSMGALAEELKTRLQGGQQEDATKLNYRVWLDRLRSVWPGKFETAQVRNVGYEFIIALRERMRVTPVKCRNWKNARPGYSHGAINQALSLLRLLLQIAVEKDVISSNPFDERGALRDSLYLPKKTRKPSLPSRSDMQRVFAEMAVVPRSTEETEEFRGRIGFLEQQARDASEHARFLAYTGMRLEEANAAMFSDLKPDDSMIWCNGTKTDSAPRWVPVLPELKKMLDVIRARGRVRGRILVPRSSRQALARACRRLSLPNMHHHDMRHYFITTCVEADVRFPVIAEWVGHKDKGALLMQVYTHLRPDHTAEEAKKVIFSAPASA